MRESLPSPAFVNPQILAKTFLFWCMNIRGTLEGFVRQMFLTELHNILYTTQFLSTQNSASFPNAHTWYLSGQCINLQRAFGMHVSVTNPLLPAPAVWCCSHLHLQQEPGWRQWLDGRSHTHCNKWVRSHSSGPSGISGLLVVWQSPAATSIGPRGAPVAPVAVSLVSPPYHHFQG